MPAGRNSDEPKFRVEVVAPVFVVKDIQRSLDYYVHKLSFSPGFEWSDNEGEPVRYAIIQNGNTELHLSQAVRPRPTNAYFFVDGVANYYEHVKAAGAIISCEIEDFPWEMREFEAADLDDNRLIFGEHMSRLEE